MEIITRNEFFESAKIQIEIFKVTGTPLSKAEDIIQPEESQND